MGEFTLNRPWAAFVVRRLGTLGLGLAVVLVATFLMIQLIPGDPARAVAGIGARPAYVQQVREDMGLTEPLAVQFGDYVTGVFRFDFGESFISGRPVSTVIADRLPKTAQLAGTALLIILGLAIPIGMLAGAYTREDRHPKTEVGFAALTGIGAAIPEFLWGIVIVFVFAVTLRWLPVAGPEGLKALVLPAVAIAFRPMASLARIVRVQTLDVLASDFIRTARGKRLPWRLIYLRHALPHLLTASLTIGGLLFTGLLGGSVVVENIFAWPGLGTGIVRAISARDYPVIQAMVLLLASAVLIVNTMLDVILATIDPRSTIRET